MLDHENSLQQEALGIVGVNLLYAACFLHQSPEKMLESLLDNLSTDRIVIDMAVFSGIEFSRSNASLAIERRATRCSEESQTASAAGGHFVTGIPTLRVTKAEDSPRRRSPL